MELRAMAAPVSDHFPGAELVVDACSPLNLWVDDLQCFLSKLSALLYLRIWNGQELED